MNPLIKDLASSVARFVSKSWPEDRHDLYEILSLAEEYVWTSGLYTGSTIYATVNNNNGTLITPNGYSILEGLAINRKPMVVKDVKSHFHVNGPGPIGADNVKRCLCDGEISLNNVYDMGQSPTMKKLKGVFKILVKPIHSCDVGEIFISGIDDCGNEIYTYGCDKEKATVSTCNECEISEKQELDIDVYQGVTYSLRKQTMYDNVLFTEITGITKSQTIGPVEIYAVYNDNKQELISRMEPFQTESVYRIYEIPNKEAKVVGLFRRTKPDKIRSDTRRFIIDSFAATLTMVSGVYKKYYEKDLVQGSAMIADAIGMLQASFQSNQSNHKKHLQITGHQFDAKGIKRF